MRSTVFGASTIRDVISEGESYVNLNTGWYCRAKHSPSSTSDLINSGQSYGYGSKDSTGGFTTKVTSETNTPVTNWNRYTYGHQPGIKKSEYDIWSAAGYPAGHQYDPANWAGIDCAGLAQRITKSVGIVPDSIIPATGNWIRAKYFVNNTPSLNLAHTYVIPSSKWKYLHRGDLISSDKHVVMIYNEPSELSDPLDTRYIRIMHADGEKPKDLTPWLHDHPENHTVFIRKVIVTSFKLWWGYSYNHYLSLVEVNSVLHGNIRVGVIRLWE